MRFAWLKQIGMVLAAGVMAAGARGQVNPHTQIKWPSSCEGAGMVYSFAINDCLASGTAANPAGTNRQIQVNAAGIFGATPATIDTLGNLFTPGKVASPYLASNVVNVSLLPNPVLGDGSDQTANMQTAANLCGAGRSLYLPPPSNYYHWVSVNLPDNCTVLGEPGTALVSGTAGTSYVDGSFVVGDHNTIKYLTWIGTSQSESLIFHAIQLAANAAKTASVTQATIQYNWFNNVNIGLYIDRGQAGVPASGVDFQYNTCTASQYCAYAIRVMDSNFSHNVFRAGIVFGGYTVTNATYTGSGPYTVTATLSTPVTGLNPPDLVQIIAPGFLFTTKVNPCTLVSVSGTTITCTTNAVPTTASGSGIMFPSPTVGTYTILSASYTGTGPWTLTLNLDPATAVSGAVVGDAVQLVIGSGPSSGLAPFILTDPDHPCILASISGTTVTCTSTLQPTYATYTSPGPETFGSMKLPQPQTSYGALAFNSVVRTRRNFNVIDGGYVYSAGRSFAIVGIVDIPRFDINLFSNVNLGFYDNQTLGNVISGIGQEHISSDIYGNNSYRSNVSEMSTIVTKARSAGFYQITLNHQAVYSNLTGCTSTPVPPAYTIHCTLPSWSASSGGATGYSGAPTVNQEVSIAETGFLVTGGVLGCTVSASSSTDFSCTWNGTAPLASSGTGGTVSEGFHANYLIGEWMCFNTGTMTGSCYQITSSSDTTNAINISQDDFNNITVGDEVTLGWPFIHTQVSNNLITMPTPLVTPYTVSSASYTGTGPYIINLTLATAITGTVANDAVQINMPGFLVSGYTDPCITISASGTAYSCTSQTQPAAAGGTGTLYTANVGQIGTYGIGFHGFSYRNVISDNTVVGNNWAVAMAPDRDRGEAYAIRSLGGLQAVGSYTYNTYNFHLGLASGNVLSNNIGTMGAMRLTGFDYHTHAYLATYSSGNRVDAFKGSSIISNAQVVRVDGIYQDPSQSTPSTVCGVNNLGSSSYYNPATGTGASFQCTQTGTSTYAWVPLNATTANSYVTINNAAQQPACAMAADTTIASLAITVGSSTGSTATITTAGFAGYYRLPRLQVTITGATPSGWNATWTVATSTGTTLTFNSAVNPGTMTGLGTVSITCANQVNDALTANPVLFPNVFTIKANTIGTTFLSSVMRAQTLNWAPASSATGPSTALYYGTSLTPGSDTKVYASASNLVTNGTNTGQFSGTMAWDIVAEPSASLLFTPSSAPGGFWTQASLPQFANGTTQPAFISNASDNNIYIATFYPATGVASGTYTSGGSITGAAGTTCNLASFNNSSTATATATLTGTNTLAGASLVIVSRGQAATAAPTTATLSSGTATCSGTATISTVLGGAPGNAFLPVTLTVRP